MNGKLLKSRLLATSVFAGFMGAMAIAPAVAQEADEPVVITEGAEAGEARQEVVTVTGSRIARPEIDTVFPTISVGSELLEAGAFTNVADALNQIPAFGGGIDPAGDQGSNIGVNFVDFLDLGTQRTLTLVNGRRFVSQNSAGTGQQVDFSIIPSALIERIDTIGVGGAPIYGSDAIAGTINVILKDDFEGLSFTAQRGQTFDFNDAVSETYQIVAGANTADGRGNVTFSAEYYNSEGLTQLARPDIYVGEPVYLRSGSGRDIDGDGVNDSFRELHTDRNIQLFTMGGLLSPTDFFIPSFGIGNFSDGNLYHFEDGSGNLVQYQVGTTVPGDSAFYAVGSTYNGFFEEVDQIQSPVERMVFGSTFRYDITDNIRASADMQFANVESIELVEQGGFQTWVFDGLSYAAEVPVTNPFFTAQHESVLTGLGYNVNDPTQTVYVNRFNNDIIDSSSGSESTTWRIAGGLEGDFMVGDREFFWDVSANAGQFTNEVFGTLINDRRFLLALDARELTAADVSALIAAGSPTDVNGVPQFGGVGDIVCNTTFLWETGTAAQRDAILQSQGLSAGSLADSAPVDITACQPLNIFGRNQASPEALDYVVNQSSFNNDIDQAVFNANFGGELFDLPAGPVGFNIGYETRRESANFQPAGADEVGLGRGSETPRTGGSYSTQEYYGELLVPLFSPEMELPFLYSAQLEASFRDIDNSIAGAGEAWTVGLRYAPIEGLEFRGNKTNSLRAPSLDELFAPITTSFQFADDPCDDRYINDRPNFQANCIADGVRVDANGDGVADGTFVSNVANATARGRSGGNPNLQNETADSWTFGVVYQPTFVDNLTLKADYINIRIDGLIQAFDLETIMNTCYDAAPGTFPNGFCGSFTRDAGNQVVDFLTGQTNADFSQNEFLQFDIDYNFDLADALSAVSSREYGDWGGVSTSLQWFHVIRREGETAGVFSNSGQNGVGGFFDPRNSASWDLTWDRGPARLFVRTLWQQGAKASADGTELYVDRNGVRVIGTDDRVITNASFAYDVGTLIPNYDNPLTLQVGVDNLFDNGVDDEIERALGDFDLAEILGRRWSIRLNAQF